MHILLISNSFQHGGGYLDHCANEIQAFLKEVSRVLFIPYALHDHAAYVKTVRARFESFDIQVDSMLDFDDLQRAVTDASALFVGGGNTFRLLKTLYDYSLVGPIRCRLLDGLPYIGASAGANIAAPSIKTTNDMPIVYPPTFDALDVIPFNINPHYFSLTPQSTHMGEARDTRLHEFHEENNVPVLALREGALLWVEDGTVRLGGTAGARLFTKGRGEVDFESGAILSFLLAPNV